MNNPTVNSGSVWPGSKELFFQRVQERTIEVLSEEGLLQVLKTHLAAGWRLVAVDDVAVDGICEGCGLPIPGEQTAWGPDEDGVILCAKCAEDM